MFEADGYKRDCRRARLVSAREQLPVWTTRQSLLQHIREHDIVVIVGETGSGKTTQIPQLLLRAGLTSQGCIACTQPRRVAAITVARRVAEELPCSLGQEVRMLAPLLHAVSNSYLSSQSKTVATGWLLSTL